MTTANTGLSAKRIGRFSIENPLEAVRRRAAALRLWWIDYCAREGLRIADDHVVCEAGFRRTENGGVVRSDRR